MVEVETSVQRWNINDGTGKVSEFNQLWICVKSDRAGRRRVQSDQPEAFQMRAQNIATDAQYPRRLHLILAALFEHIAYQRAFDGIE